MLITYLTISKKSCHRSVALNTVTPHHPNLSPVVLGNHLTQHRHPPNLAVEVLHLQALSEEPRLEGLSHPLIRRVQKSTAGVGGVEVSFILTYDLTKNRLFGVTHHHIAAEFVLLLPLFGLFLLYRLKWIQHLYV